MYGIAPAAVLDEMDSRDAVDLCVAGLRFERLRGAVWMSALADGIGGVSAVSPAPVGTVRPPPAVPATLDEYQEPDRGGFARVARGG